MLSGVSSPAVSPAGHWLVYQRRKADLAIDGGRNRSWCRSAPTPTPQMTPVPD